MKQFHILLLSIIMILSLNTAACLANPYEKISVFEISSIDPTPETNPIGANYPGIRGGNQLIMYTSSYGKYTRTNEYGAEITVINNRVVSKSGSNSMIPPKGFVLSGHGEAKKWLNTNTIIGTYINIDQKDNLVKATTDANSYIYASRKLIKEANNLIKLNNKITPDKYIKVASEYLNKATLKNDKALELLKKKNYELSIDQSKESYEAAKMSYLLAIKPYTGIHKGIWCRPKEKTEAEIENTIERIANTGINTIYLETFFHGYTIYPSEVAKKYGIIQQNPIFKGTDPLKSWINIASSYNINIIPWVETFYVGTGTPGPILSVYPEWANIQRSSVYYSQLKPSSIEPNAYFLDPANPDSRKYIKELILEMINEYDIKGVNLDYIRYPSSIPEDFPNYLSSTWGYSKYARGKFKSIYKIDPLDLYIDDKEWGLWKKYLQNNVNLMVKETYDALKNSDKEIELSAVIFPDLEKASTQKMQNWKCWVKGKYIDTLTPIILGSSPKMIEDTSKTLLNETKNKINIYVGVFGAFNNDTPITFAKQIQGASSVQIQGINIFDAAHLNPEYQNALKVGPFKE